MRWRSRRQAPAWGLGLRELAGERPRYGYAGCGGNCGGRATRRAPRRSGGLPRGGSGAAGRLMQNGFIESFNGRMRDECLNLHEFATVPHLRAVVTAWRADYNQVRPHSGLDGLTPSQAAQKHRAGSEPSALRPPDASRIHRSDEDPQPAECFT
ncbi:MAG: transposase [Acidobacteria bacterium]|nr:MAG: transposase [Acidobacteriota bacterium]